MADIIKFTSTALSGTGKKGILKPDENGYYELVIGGLNAFNSVGEYYTLEGAAQLFESSSPFMRRIRSGCLKGEVGHPKKLPGMTMDDYMRRIMSIEETNTCAHFSDIWLDTSYGRNNPDAKNQNLVAIVAKVKPAGAKGQALEDALNNPKEDVCFSIRALTKDYMHRGQTNRVLNTIFTFDWVTEPGIHIARKYKTPGLESLMDSFVSYRDIKAAVESICDDPIAIESSKQMAVETLNAFENAFKQPTQPLFTQW